MPDWSRLFRQRDLFGELAWLPNFQVTTSKHNERLHRTFKQFFDQP